MQSKDEIHRFDHIINLPHPNSGRHARMSMEARAAQFAPFAALTGYEAAVKETARLTQDRVELEEEDRKKLNQCLRYLEEHLSEEPEITVKYFLPDTKKAGGAIVMHTGRLKKIDLYHQQLVFSGAVKLPIADLLHIEGDMLTFDD